MVCSALYCSVHSDIGRITSSNRPSLWEEAVEAEAATYICLVQAAFAPVSVFDPA